MKRLFGAIVMLLPLASYCQEKFSINGQYNDGRTKGRIYLTYFGAKGFVRDSAELDKGHFLYKGEVRNFPALISIKYSPGKNGFLDIEGNFCQVYCDAPETVLEISNELTTAKVTGSKMHEEAMRYKEFIRVPGNVDSMGMPPVNGLFAFGKMTSGKVSSEMKTMALTQAGTPVGGPAQNGPLSAKLKPQGNALPVNNVEAKPKTAADSAMNARVKIQAAAVEERNKAVDVRRALQKKWIELNPDSYMSLMALKEIAGMRIVVQDVEPYYNLLSDRLKQHPEAIEIAQRVAAEKKNPSREPDVSGQMMAMMQQRKDATKASFAIGSELPDFTLNDTKGNPVKLSDFRGKYVLLDFWASWCGPCRKENPNLIEAYKKYKKKNFTILSVSIELKGDTQKWLDAIKKDGLTWTQVVDYDAFNAGVAKQYKIQAIPQNYLLGPDGKVIAVTLRGEALQEKLEEILK